MRSLSNKHWLVRLFVLSLLLPVFRVVAPVEPDRVDLFCLGNRFTLIYEYGGVGVYFDDNNGGKIFIGHLTEYSLPGMQALFIETPSGEHCVIGKSNVSGKIIEVRVNDSGFHDRLDNGYFIFPITGEESISAFKLAINNERGYYSIEKEIDPPFLPYYFLVSEVVEDYEWSRAKSQ